MHMKKLMMFLGFALSFSGLSYGMNEKSKLELEALNAAISMQQWGYVVNELLKEEGNASKPVRGFVLTHLPVELNKVNGDNPGLFEVLFDRYQSGWKSIDEFNYIKQLLGELVFMRGLDCAVKRRGNYVIAYD